MMNKSLTDNFNFIRKFDELAAEIYRDRKYYYLPVKDIAKYHGIPESEVKELVLKAKHLINDKNTAWLNGLSNRAKAALIKNRYKEFSALYADVMSEKIDLESFNGVGHKVALEIRRWCLSHS